jgi:hypothetical protein
MAPCGDSMIKVIYTEGDVIIVHHINHHGVEGGEGVVWLKFDGRGDGFGDIYGGFAGVGLCVSGKVGNPFVIEGNALLWGSFRVVIGAGCCYYVEPQFLN